MLYTCIEVALAPHYSLSGQKLFCGFYPFLTQAGAFLGNEHK
jgi:hypothetical protein